MRQGYDRSVVAGVVLLAVMIVGIATSSYLNTHRLWLDADRAARSRAVLDAVGALRAEARKLQAGQRAYLISGEEQALQPYHEASGAIHDGVARLQQLTEGDADQNQRAVAAGRDVETGLDNMRDVIAIRRNQGFLAVLQLAPSRGIRTFIDPLLDTLAAVDERERERLAVQEDQTRLAYTRAVLYGVVAAGLGLLAVAMFVWVLRRSYRARARDLADMAAQRELLDATLTSIGDGVIATDAGGGVIFLNTVAERLTGWTQAEARGLPLERIFHVVKIAPPHAAGRASGDGPASQAVLIDRAGTERPVEELAAPIHSRGGVNGAVLVFRDVTTRKRADEEREQLLNRLREQDKRKDEFIATLAHELRNPLAPIRSGVQILRTVTAPGAPAEQALAMMERQLGHMIHLVDDLMDVSRVSGGKIILKRERVGLRAVIDDGIEAARGMVEAAGHRLDVRTPDAPLAFDADRTRLAQVFANLLNNAAKYTPHGGRITLAAERAGTEAVIRVSDTGVGIPADMLPKVFDLFTQVGTSLDRSQGGLGIGLTLVRRLVELHGGRVEVASEGPGRGSEFTVHLPLAPDTPMPDAAGPESPARSPDPGLRVLIVDDNRDAAESLAMLLDLGGCQTRTAHDGATALAAAAAFQPALLLLDIGMPGMNGYEVAARIRQTPTAWGLTIVALTGWGADDDRRKTREAGFDFHLVKPADPAQLGKILATVKAGRAARPADPTI